MCGIAGIIDTKGGGRLPRAAVPAMAQAIYHRGPDEDGFLDQPDLSFASRRLSIVGLQDGRQPITNEDRSVWVVFNGELFDYPEKRAELEAKGHRFATHTDTELIPHLWEEYGEGMFEHLSGQFAFALWDSRKRVVILARDRIGICPLYWTVQRPTEGEFTGGEFLLFASEVKGLLASGMVKARPDPEGLNHVFSFFATPGPATCFAGVNLLLPGKYLRLELDGQTPDTTPRTYWQLDFPDQGQERVGDVKQLTDEFEQLLMAAVQRRLRADVPVVSYLSGGVDSSVVVAMACKAMGRPIPTFTIGIQDKGLNEENEAQIVARHVGSKPLVVPFDRTDVLATYPELIRAAEVPVVDTACAALLRLAKSVRANNYKVALTGEGSDEWMAGYPWFKAYKGLSLLDVTGLPVSHWLRGAAQRLFGLPRFSKHLARRAAEATGGYTGWHDTYGLMSMSKLRFYGPEMRKRFIDHCAYDDLGIDHAKLMRWHPFHRSLFIGLRVHLPGLLLSSKGDRVAMNSSVETRYPFLDEQVTAFLAKLHPRYKLRGLFGDKYLVRKVSERWLPKEIAWRSKKMFRAPLEGFNLDESLSRHPWVNQVLSDESIRKAGYFDPAAVRDFRVRSLKMRSLARTSVELGLVGVTATQLWHHLYIDGSLCDLPAVTA
jgi:asparagine synthase (glutamine-hydrolysing)